MSTVDKNPVFKSRSSEVSSSETSSVVDELEMKARVKEILNRWPTVGLAVGVVRNGQYISLKEKRRNQKTRKLQSGILPERKHTRSFRCTDYEIWQSMTRCVSR